MPSPRWRGPSVVPSDGAETRRCSGDRAHRCVGRHRARPGRMGGVGMGSRSRCARRSGRDACDRPDRFDARRGDTRCRAGRAGGPGGRGRRAGGDAAMRRAGDGRGRRQTARGDGRCRTPVRGRTPHGGQGDVGARWCIGFDVPGRNLGAHHRWGGGVGSGGHRRHGPRARGQPRQDDGASARRSGRPGEPPAARDGRDSGPSGRVRSCRGGACPVARVWAASLPWM